MVVGGGLTRLEVGVDEGDAEAEAKRVSRVTLLLPGVGAGEADGMRVGGTTCPSPTQFNWWP